MTSILRDFPLETRTGLPDELAYLRPAYPNEGWGEHPNFGGLAAFWLQTHESLRHDGRSLGALTEGFREGRADAGAFQRRFISRLRSFVQSLDGHHRIEDLLYFPKFRALDRRMVAGFDLLEADHKRIHEALLDSAKGGQALLRSLEGPPDVALAAADSYSFAAERLLALLLRHLADEEDLIIPAMLHHGERPLS
jgi:hypothetical protein